MRPDDAPSEPHSTAMLPEGITAWRRPEINGDGKESTPVRWKESFPSTWIDQSGKSRGTTEWTENTERIKQVATGVAAIACNRGGEAVRGGIREVSPPEPLSNQNDSSPVLQADQESAKCEQWLRVAAAPRLRAIAATRISSTSDR
ncbi:MAG TPA: hypothetical protein VNQ76_02595 [Planctomicrobium sp.]|nr:hypothetical protein [Planctomicrobium sp.]